MTKLLFSPLAQQDIEAIYDYTISNWGILQADTYLDLIQTACEDLCNGRHSGQDASYVRAGYRRQKCKSHIIFYRQTEQRTKVIRVLHQKMDVTRHFGESEN